MSVTAAVVKHRHFAHALRTSRIATFDPIIPQVYITSNTNASQGDWGIKQRIPYQFASSNPYITIRAQDSKYNIPVFKNANEKVALVRRWKEHFESDIFRSDQSPPGSHRNPLHAEPRRLKRKTEVKVNLPSSSTAVTCSPYPQQPLDKPDLTTQSVSSTSNSISNKSVFTGLPINVLKLTPRRFEKLCRALSKDDVKAVFNEKLSKAPNQARNEQWLEYLNLTFNPHDDMSFRPHPVTYSQPSSSLPSSESLSPKLSTQQTYVQGRVLSRHSSGYTIGLSGVTANYHGYGTKKYGNVGAGNKLKSGSILSNLEHKHIQEFVVKEAYWDDKGRPVVKVDLYDTRRNPVTGRFTNVTDSHPRNVKKLRTDLPLVTHDKYVPQNRGIAKLGTWKPSRLSRNAGSFSVEVNEDPMRKEVLEGISSLLTDVADRKFGGGKDN